MDENNPTAEWNLQLTEENVLNSFLTAFSYPDRITYQEEEYNFTNAYDTFWKQFFNSPAYLDEYKKLPKLSLGNEKLKSLARIIRRGWHDERYLPTTIPYTFLKSCIFGKQTITKVSAETMLEFIGDENKDEVCKTILRYEKNPLDGESLKVLKKYCPDASISTSNLNEACSIIVYKILDEFNVIVQEWNKELKDLLDLKEFNFVMKQRKACLSRENPDKSYNDLTNLDKDLPHRIWTTFFLDWSEDQIDFYFNMLRRNDSITCKCGSFDSKHLMGNDTVPCDSLTNTERHDWVLDEIEEKLKEALHKEGTFFASANDWKFLRRLESKEQYYKWPEELGIAAADDFKFPHLLVYSMTPPKKVMIVEASVMWEEWYTRSPVKRKFQTKTEEFKNVVEKLKRNGFEVDFKDIEMGCRGVLCRQLYHLLNKDFKMEHGEVSKTMEAVSKGIVSFPYEKYLKDKTNDKTPKKNLKRKYEYSTKKFE